MALLAGLLAAIVAAVIWGYIAALTKHEYSIVAVGVGLAVGAAVMWARGGGPGDVALAAGVHPARTAQAMPAIVTHRTS